MAAKTLKNYLEKIDAGEAIRVCIEFKSGATR